jgi:hypothetical protein
MWHPHSHRALFVGRFESTESGSKVMSTMASRACTNSASPSPGRYTQFKRGSRTETEPYDPSLVAIRWPRCSWAWNVDFEKFVE